MSGLFDTLKGNARKRWPSFVDFLLSGEIMTDKGTYTFNGHAPFRPIAETMGEVIQKKLPNVSMVGKKGTQIGFSTLAIAFLTWAVLRGYNVGYFLPDAGFAGEFDRERVAPIINASPTLTAAQSQRVDTARLLARNWFWTVGLFTAKGAISRPMDIGGWDEVDVISKPMLELSEERLNASPLALELKFCRGLYSGAGIDLAYDQGCGYRWTLTCGCGLSFLLEETFPDCAQRCPDSGTWRAVCPSCHTPIDVNDGVYVAQRPKLIDERRYSYQLPSLAFKAMNFGRIMGKWKEAQGRPSAIANFYGAVLALIRAGAGQPITDQMLAGCWGDHGLVLSAGARPRFMGVDVGDSCHMWVHERTDDGRKRLVWAEEFAAQSMVSTVEKRTAELGVAARVIDMMPYKTDALKIAFARPFSTWVQSFTDKDNADITVLEETDEGRPYRRVSVPRTSSLDNFCDDFAAVEDDGRWLLPNRGHGGEITEVIRQLKALVREQTTNKRGTTVLRYKSGVDNHYAMAGNSARIAEYLHGGGSAAISMPEVISGGRRVSSQLTRGLRL